MSYDVTCIKVIREQNFGIRAGRVGLTSGWPEVNPTFLWGGVSFPPNTILPLTRNGGFYWSGGFSGKSWAMLRDLLVPNKDMRWDAYRGSDALVYPATLAYYDSEPGTKLWGLSRTERSAAMFAAGWTHFAVIGK